VYNENRLKTISPENDKSLHLDILKGYALSPYLSNKEVKNLTNLNIPVLNDILDFKNDFNKNIYSRDKESYNLFTTLVMRTIHSRKICDTIRNMYDVIHTGAYLERDTYNALANLLDKHISKPNVSKEFQSALLIIKKNLVFMNNRTVNLTEKQPFGFSYKRNEYDRLYLKCDFNNFTELKENEIKELTNSFKKYNKDVLEYLKKEILENILYKYSLENRLLCDSLEFSYRVMKIAPIYDALCNELELKKNNLVQENDNNLER
jgi:hypothetical protein